MENQNHTDSNNNNEALNIIPKEIVYKPTGTVVTNEIPITIADVYAATRKLKGKIYKTQIDYSNTISKLSGCKVYLKLENLQKTGSFKIRGAMNKIMSLTEEQKKKGVVAASAGNHAQGVAYSATLNGVKSTICMPIFAPTAKADATRGYGANVVLYGNSFDEALAQAQKICKETGAIFVHPFDDPYVMAGQGTIAMEILEDLQNVDVIVTAIGGGGLVSGIAYTIKQLKPEVRVIGVQAETAPSMYISKQLGEIYGTETAKTVADGIAVKVPGASTFNVVNQYVDEVVLVSNEEIQHAMLLMVERCKIVSEGAGATPVAALLSGKISGLTENTVVCCVVSGGNLDMKFLNSVICMGLHPEPLR